MINEMLGVVGNPKLIAAADGDSAIRATDLAGAGVPDSSASTVTDLAGNLVVAVPRNSNTDSPCVREAIDYPIRFLLSGMKAGYQAGIKLYEMEDEEGWTVGEHCDLLVGVSVNFLTINPSENLNDFSIRQRELDICVNQDCERIDVCLYVRTKRSFLKGSIQLPQGGLVTVESVIDRASLSGVSSFGIALY